MMWLTIFSDQRITTLPHPYCTELWAVQSFTQAHYALDEIWFGSRHGDVAVVF